MEFGLHIADFTWSTGQRQLGPALAKHVRNAEAAGIQRITVMDHFWQLPGIGPVEHEMLEAYATLGFLVAHTEKVLLHTLVTGVIYREPALLAKQVTTLDVLSGGRVGLGIGAAWNEQESRGLGFTFPPVAERFRQLEETIQICLQMWSEEEEPYRGALWQLERTLNSPQSITRPHPYLMIGGGGEKKTLRLVAQYADACNLGVSSKTATQARCSARALRCRRSRLRRHREDRDDRSESRVDARDRRGRRRRARRPRLHRDVCVFDGDHRAGAGRRGHRRGGGAARLSDPSSPAWEEDRPN